jgi:hypothetical protein
VTSHRLVPPQIDTERLADLLDDARAIPAAAFSRPAAAVRRRIDLTAMPVQRVAVRIPAASVSLVEAAEHHFADYSR